MLPARSNGWLLFARLSHDLRNRSGEISTERSGDGEVVETPDGVLEREDELRRRYFACEGHNDAIN